MADRRADLPGRDVLNRTDVGADGVFDVVQDAGLDHGGRALQGFFGGLEEELQRPAADLAHQAARGRQKHRRVGVVAAGVDRAVLAVDLEGERVHVGAKQHDRARFRAADDADHARGAAHVRLRLDPERLKLLGDVGRGAEFLEPEFGHLVEFAAKGRGIVNEGHRYLLMGRMCVFWS